jgi:hypothetical protein
MIETGEEDLPEVPEPACPEPGQSGRTGELKGPGGFIKKLLQAFPKFAAKPAAPLPAASSPDAPLPGAPLPPAGTQENPPPGDPRPKTAQRPAKGTLAGLIPVLIPALLLVMFSGPLLAKGEELEKLRHPKFEQAMDPGFLAEAMGKEIFQVALDTAASVRYHEILNDIVFPAEKDLDDIFDFSKLVVPVGQLWLEPPVVSNITEAISLRAPDYGRGQGQTYRLVRSGRFLTGIPSWRNYIYPPVMELKTPGTVHHSLYPKEKIEWEIWNRELDRGWQTGIDTAEALFNGGIALMVRDYLGLMYFWELNGKGLMTGPTVSQTKIPFQIRENEMLWDEIEYEILEPGQFQEKKKAPAKKPAQPAKPGPAGARPDETAKPGLKMIFRQAQGTRLTGLRPETAAEDNQPLSREMIQARLRSQIKPAVFYPSKTEPSPLKLAYLALKNGTVLPPEAKNSGNAEPPDASRSQKAGVKARPAGLKTPADDAYVRNPAENPLPSGTPAPAPEAAKNSLRPEKTVPAKSPAASEKSAPAGSPGPAEPLAPEQRAQLQGLLDSLDRINLEARQ